MRVPGDCATFPTPTGGYSARMSLMMVRKIQMIANIAALTFGVCLLLAGGAILANSL